MLRIHDNLNVVTNLNYLSLLTNTHQMEIIIKISYQRLKLYVLVSSGLYDTNLAVFVTVPMSYSGHIW